MLQGAYVECLLSPLTLVPVPVPVLSPVFLSIALT
jgi:hypothetical protein